MTMVGGRRHMARRARSALAVAAVLTAVVATACGGGGDSSDVVQVTDVSGVDRVLVDVEGRTLYVTEQEAGRKVECVGACLDVWRPLTVAEGAQLSSDERITHSLATVERADGERQVTFDGYPLYTFAEDGSSGDMKGNAVTDEFGGTSFTWHAMTSSGPAPSSSPTDSSEDGGGGFGY